MLPHPVRGIYQHYKGAYYEVIDVAHHSETEEPLVVYRALYGEYGLWCRPLGMFMETVIANDNSGMAGGSRQVISSQGGNMKGDNMKGGNRKGEVARFRLVKAFP